LTAPSKSGYAVHSYAASRLLPESRLQKIEPLLGDFGRRGSAIIKRQILRTKEKFRSDDRGADKKLSFIHGQGNKKRLGRSPKC
jgi:hypothetical protein